MTFYLDTCVLLAALTPEAHSAAALRFLTRNEGRLAVSSWCETELVSALGLKLRTRQLDESQAQAVLETYERELTSAFEHFAVEDLDLRNASRCLRGWPSALRAGDALHVAIAAGRATTLCSFDRALVEAAIQLGLEAELIPTD